MLWIWLSKSLVGNKEHAVILLEPATLLPSEQKQVHVEFPAILLKHMY